MKKFNNKSGFTLIEIIVVMIIVGILAAIALPNLFSNVRKSQGTAGIQVMDNMKTAIETYIATNQTIPATNSNATLISVGLPVSDAVFNYTIGTTSGTISGNNVSYVLTATSIATPSATILLTRNTTGSFTCSSADAIWSTACQ